MGLDFSHCEAHWAYSGFNRFRIRLAAKIGINLDEMEGFAAEHTKQGWIPNENAYSWNKIKDPIVFLLKHSDCDGELSPKECEQIAPRLRDLVKDWKNDDYDKEQAMILSEGMEQAAENNEPFEFC